MRDTDGAGKEGKIKCMGFVFFLGELGEFDIALVSDFNPVGNTCVCDFPPPAPLIFTAYLKPCFSCGPPVI